ncbi:DUF885 domain-containing protein [Sphingomonas sp. RB1R13]|uniref:DUF885 domain-containing protein n=1 Tax=Sphingomonas sp. RB1R13 TaxID=3096159 RepID=UPI002FCAA1EC
MIERTPGQRLAELAERYWKQECEESTLTAVLAGEPSDATYLFRASPADAARRDRAAADMLSELDKIFQQELLPGDRITHGLLRRELNAVREQFSVQAHLKPWLLPAGPEFNTIFFANSTALSSAEDAALYVERLRSIEGFLGDIRASLAAGLEAGHRYPRTVLEAALPAIRALGGGNPRETAWYGPFKRAAIHGGEFDEAAERAASVIEEVVQPALRAYSDFLAGPMSAAARETLSCTDAPNGRTYYQSFVRYFTTTDMSPDEIHQLGLNEVARIAGEMDTVSVKAGFASMEAYREHLSTSPEFVIDDPERLREQLEALCKRIDRRIPAFFKRLPRITYGVESMPPTLAASMPPAYAQPSPADNSTAGIFWVTSLPERCPTYMHLPLALHEAWPGHLMHIAMLQEADKLPAFRRNGAVKYTVLVEGWALYCETLGIEMGLYETLDQHFGRLQMEMWRAVRLVVDTGLHWHNWSREQAIGYFAKHVALPEETIAQEVDRYVALPAQALAYQIGNLKMRELRTRAERALGSHFSVRDFHAAIISGGAVSLPVLEMIVDDWIEEQKVNSLAA